MVPEGLVCGGFEFAASSKRADATFRLILLSNLTEVACPNFTVQCWFRGVPTAALLDNGDG